MFAYRRCSSRERTFQSWATYLRPIPSVQTGNHGNVLFDFLDELSDALIELLKPFIGALPRGRHAFRRRLLELVQSLNSCLNGLHELLDFRLQAYPQ